jgi:hypothetical protein
VERRRTPGLANLNITDRLHVQDAVMRGHAVKDAWLAPVAVQVARRTRRRLTILMVCLLAVGLLLVAGVGIAGADGDGARLLQRLGLFVGLLTLPFLLVLHVHRRAERNNEALAEAERGSGDQLGEAA